LQVDTRFEYLRKDADQIASLGLFIVEGGSI
jgi:hypothetical protein